MLHPEDRERILAEDARADTRGEPFDAEYRCVARDGRTVWVHDKAVVTRDEKGRPRFSLARVLDREVVAERVEAGDQGARLRESGFNRAQEFYLAEWLPSEEVSALLAADASA